jgi:hypothetical protein
MGSGRVETRRGFGVRIAAMTRRIVLGMAVLSVMFAALALAADISGSWTGAMSMGDNQFSLTYTFKVDGEKLTGSVGTPQGDSLPLIDGKITGDKLSFSVKTEMGNGPVKFVCEGTVKGEDAILLSTKSEDGTEFGGGPITLKRAK